MDDIIKEIEEENKDIDDNKKIDEIIKNNPSLLDKYPILEIEYNRDGIELSQNFINIINSLIIQNVEICGRVIHKLGSLTA